MKISEYSKNWWWPTKKEVNLFIDGFLFSMNLTKGVDTTLTWHIVMTTKRDAKISNSLNSYAMFVFEDGVLIMKSEESTSHAKNSWNSEDYINFLLTLKKV